MAIQLPLGIGLRDESTFENFVAIGNEQLVDTLINHAGEDKIVYLWGGNSVGKTHLLQAWCKRHAENGLSVAFLPLLQYQELAPDICEGLENLDAVCIDDIQAVAGISEWEEALFHLYNRMRDAAKLIIISANAAPLALGLKLADLVSRLNAALILHVTGLDDQGKMEVLKLRALARGLELSDEAAQFLIRHYPRDMSILLATLDKLDHASLAAQRRLTIPFIKQVMQQ
jgi:DnaA family protein